MNSEKRTFHRTIIFSKTRMLRMFRYRDMFQVFPATLKKLPKSKIQKHYPLILEYWTTENEKIRIESDFLGEYLKDFRAEVGARINKEDLILNLLSLISNHLFFRYEDQTGAWGFPIDDNQGEMINSLSSKWCLPMYHWPELPKQLKISSFSDPGLQTVSFVSRDNYYMNDPNFDYYPDRNITFPILTEKILDSYFTQPESIKEVIDSAISYSKASMELRQSKKSLSILSSFTALETMINLEYKEYKVEKCYDCGQSKFQVVKKYRDFLFKYLGESENNKRKFNSYYTLRSKIVHAGHRLKSERLYSNTSKEVRHTELVSHIEILQLSKMAIAQWLLMNSVSTGS